MKHYGVYMAIMGLLVVGRVAAQDTIPAFPEARGWGAEALVASRAKPLKVHFVTNTNDSGAGSFRQALTDIGADSFNIIIFRTGGRILNFGGTAFSDLAHTYIAGQTAPGGGFTVADGRIRVDPIGTNTDVVVRYLTLAKGTQENIRICGENVILDHISSYWSSSSGGGGDNALMSCAGDGTPVEFFGSYTVSNNLACEPHNDHATVMTLQSRLNTGYRNFLCGPARRFPNIVNDSSAINQGQTGTEWLNNIVYNWRGDGGPTAFTRNITVADVLENYYKHGPGGELTPLIRYMPGVWRDGEDSTKIPWFYMSIYWCNNRSIQNNYDRTIACDSAWADGGNYQQLVCNRLPESFAHFTPNDCAANDDPIPTVYRRSIPLAQHIADTAKFPYLVQPITDAFLEDEILALVGNSQGLNCDGTWTFRRSAYDSTKIQQFRDSTGLSVYIDWEPAYNHPDSTPAVAVPASGTPCQDTDSDGMPDEWEAIYGADSVAVRNDSVSVSGYLMIEHYLNGSNPNNPTPWAEPKYTATWFAFTDSSFAAYRMLLVRDTIITGGGADTIIVLAPHRDTLPLGDIYDVHPDCMLGDTAIITTRDTLHVSADTLIPLTIAQVDSLASAWGANCTSTILQDRKVNGGFADAPPPPNQTAPLERWAKPEWGLVA